MEIYNQMWGQKMLYWNDCINFNCFHDFNYRKSIFCFQNS
jgi:hypothetical protein